MKNLQKLIKEIDKNKSNSDDTEVQMVTRKVTRTGERLNLFCFTCSTIDPKFLYSQECPEQYVSLDPKGNNLDVDLPVLMDLYKKILDVYPNTLLTVMIGNTDPYYIYSQQKKIYPRIDKEDLMNRYKNRWEEYRTNLKDYIAKQYHDIPFEVKSWYAFETEIENAVGWNFESSFTIIYKNIQSYFPTIAFEKEFEKLKNAFGAGKYFVNIPKPDDKILHDWIKRKFAEYALQGMWIKLFYPNTILLQNEKPSSLRSMMYQVLNEKILKSSLPIIYPFGVDNEGFQ